MAKLCSKATAAKKSGNWDTCITFLTHAGVKGEFLEGIPQGDKTTMVSSFTTLVWRNKFNTTNKSKLLHVTVKGAVLDVSESFRMALWVNLTLDASGQKYLILQRQIWGYKSVDPTTKHHKDIPTKLVFHIYRKQKSHLSTVIRQLIVGYLLFVMRSCQYSTTPKR